MQDNQFSNISRKDDVQQPVLANDTQEAVFKEQIGILLQKYAKKIEEQILKGNIHIFDRHQMKDELSELQQLRHKKQIQLNLVLTQENQERAKQLKRQIIKLKQNQTQMRKQQSKSKQKYILQQIKKWEEIQSEIQLKKQREIAQKLKKQNQEQEKIKTKLEEEEKRKQIEKKKQIQKKLKQIQNNRAKREKILKFAQVQYSKLHPKYTEIQKKFKQIEEQIKFQEQLLKKNHKIATIVDYNAIKSHQREYMTIVNQRKEMRDKMRSSKVEEINPQQFTLHTHRDQTKIQQERQKFKRRIKFQQRLKSIPIEIDEEKRKQSQIARDKGHNKAKYYFLGQKSLNEQQIYEQFKNFEINVNPKQLGKQYLKELPEITQGSRISKSQSLHTLSQRQVSQKIKYKDYLQDIKASRPVKNQISDESLSLKVDSNSKARVFEQLENRQKKYGLQLKKRKQQLQRYNSLQSSLKKVKQIDEVYSKSIKMKLARIELNP